MPRYLFLVAVGVTLAASLLAYKNQAAAQTPEGASAEGTAETSQSDASASGDTSGSATTGQAQSGTSASGQTQSDTQTSSGASNQAGNQSTSGNTSDSQPATNDGAAKPSTTSDADNSQNNTDNNKSQSSQSSSAPPSPSKPNDADAVPSPQQPRTNDQQSAEQGAADANRNQADVSVQGRARLDARTQQSSRDALQRGLQFGQARNRGLSISQVEQNSIYYRSGFRRGDVIISLYGRPVRSQGDFMRFIIMQPGQRVPVVVLRGGRQQTIYVDYPQEVVQTQHIYDNRVPQAGGAYLGVMFNAQVRDAAVVLSVNRGTPAEKAGMQGGDIILAMNGQEIRSYPDVISMIRTMRPGQEVEIVVRRDESETQVFAVLDAQANVRTANRQADVHVQHQPLRADQRTEVQVEVNRRGNDNRLLDRDRNNDGNPDRTLLPRLRN